MVANLSKQERRKRGNRGENTPTQYDQVHWKNRQYYGRDQLGLFFAQEHH